MFYFTISPPRITCCTDRSSRDKSTQSPYAPAAMRPYNDSTPIDFAGLYVAQRTAVSRGIPIDTADTGSQCDHHNIFTAFGTALPHFAQCSDIRIIARLHSKSRESAQFPGYMYLLSAQIDTLAHHTVLPDRPRNTDSDALYFIPANASLSASPLQQLLHPAK